MKHRILKKFVKAYRPYGLSREGVLLGMKEEGHVRKHPECVIWI